MGLKKGKKFAKMRIGLVKISPKTCILILEAVQIGTASKRIFSRGGRRRWLMF